MRRILNDRRRSTPGAGTPCTAGWVPVTRKLRCGGITQQPPGDSRAGCFWHAEGTGPAWRPEGRDGGRGAERPWPRAPPACTALALGLLVLITLGGWIGARQIRSPAQVAADTAAPKPSPITIPVVRRTLAAKVIVRGTVRFGAPQAVVLANSQLKQGGTSATS